MNNYGRDFEFRKLSAAASPPRRVHGFRGINNVVGIDFQLLIAVDRVINWSAKSNKAMQASVNQTLGTMFDLFRFSLQSKNVRVLCLALDKMLNDIVEL